MINILVGNSNIGQTSEHSVRPQASLLKFEGKSKGFQVGDVSPVRRTFGNIQNGRKISPLGSKKHVNMLVSSIVYSYEDSCFPYNFVFLFSIPLGGGVLTYDPLDKMRVFYTCSCCHFCFAITPYNFRMLQNCQHKTRFLDIAVEEECQALDVNSRARLALWTARQWTNIWRK